MIKYDKLWLTMQQRGITKYTHHKEYHFSKSLIHRLQNNEGVSMNTINTLCNILDEKITKELVNATIDTVYVYDKKRIEVVFSFDDVLMKAIEKYQKGVKEA